MEVNIGLPIEITRAQRNNPYIINKLAQEAFSLANYDMSPDNAVEEALRLRLIVIKPTEGVISPPKINRMPGNGSFV